jgi:ornithine carbamoyltransferase
MAMSKKDLISIADLDRQEIFKILKLARTLKKEKRQRRDLTGKSLGLIFQKPSTRTAVSFSVGMSQLGGHSLILQGEGLQMGRGESPADTGKVLSQYLDGIMIRANRHSDVVEMAQGASIPVINGLTEKEHPCQVLADLLTILEARKLQDPAALAKERVTYLGDGNNVAQSWMLAAGLVGFHLTLACPEHYDPDAEFFKKAEALAFQSGSFIRVVRDPSQGAQGATVLYTDVWASMGKEHEREHRKSVFSPYQLNPRLLALADPRVCVMHCLPAHRNEEITSDILDGPHSVVIEQAANRLHVQKAVLLHLLKKRK